MIYNTLVQFTNSQMMEYYNMTQNIAIIINSCYKFHRTTIQPIIDSAVKAHIPSANIYIVVGESDENSPIIREEYFNIVYCNCVNIDYNGVMYMTLSKEGRTELQKYTHFFYLHDTCEFMPHFWDKICESAPACDSYVKLQECYSKNIGLFNVKWFLETKTELLKDFFNTDRGLAMEYKSGDFVNKAEIYRKHGGLGNWLNEDAIFTFDEHRRPIGAYFNAGEAPYAAQIETPYGGGRRRLECPNPGIIKFQRNWGESKFVLSL